MFKEHVCNSKLYYFYSEERRRYLHNKLCRWKTVTEGGNISNRNHRLRSGLHQTKRLTTSFAPISHAARARVGKGNAPQSFQKQKDNKWGWYIHSGEREIVTQQMCAWKPVTDMEATSGKHNHRLWRCLPKLKDFYPHLRRSPMLLARVGKGNPPHFSKTEGHQTRVIHSEEWNMWENRGTLKVIDQHQR